jgi:multicomponent K+:H+ antiporter subunit G
MTIATIVYFSVQGYSLFLHAILIVLFIALTTPITTIFLMRAALFRERQKGGNVPPQAKSG